MPKNLPVEKLIINQDRPLREALVRIDGNGLGFLMVVGPEGKLAGVMTDGDVRRSLLKGATLDDPVGPATVTDCVTMPFSASTEDIGAALSERIAWIPLLDDTGRPVDYTGLARRRHFPVMEPFLNGREEDYVVECIRSGWISSQGRFVVQFEKMVAQYHDVEHALAVCNGTTALHLALVSLNVGPGDEVIVPDFTFAATAAAVVHAGARPVFVDVDSESWTISPAAVEEAITPSTKAIIPVHLYGHPCRMDRIMEIAKYHGLLVIEDCAEAFGAKQGGRLVGRFGDAACYSFFGNKVLTTGEGGLILFRDASVYDRARMLRDHGMDQGRKYWHLEPGFNYRMTNLQAAVGVAQLERVDEILNRKAALARMYDQALQDIPGIIVPPRAEWADPVCWLYTVKLTDDIHLDRNDLIERMLLNGIETRPAFYPLHAMPAYERFDRGGRFPATTMLSRCCMSLPSAVKLTSDEVAQVADALASAVRLREVCNSMGLEL